MKSIVRFCAAMAVLLSHTLSSAGVVYHYGQLPFGDTALAVDMNDHGDYVVCCFGDSGHLRSYLPRTGQSVLGFDGTDFDVMVEDINNAGDMRGKATRNGVLVDTVWIGGVPYEVGDPALGGAGFVFDAGPKYDNSFDLLSLNVLDLPECFQPDQGCSVTGGALTNARGDFIFPFTTVGSFPFQSNGILVRGIPEPQTLPLSAGALAVMVMALTRSRRWASRRTRAQRATHVISWPVGPIVHDR